MAEIRMCFVAHQGPLLEGAKSLVREGLANDRSDAIVAICESE
jgi:hypothetical protein